MKRLLTVAAIASTLPMSAMAQTERDLDSHVHGAAILNVAVAAPAVFIELGSPWNNFVGFEHAPETDEQKEAVAAALEKLQDASMLFAFDGGDCTLVGSDIKDAMSEHDEHAHDEEHDEHKDEHAHDEEHDEHKDEHAHADEEHDEHKDEHAHADEEHDEHKDEHAHADDHDEHKDEHAHDDHEGESMTHSSVLASYQFECKDTDSLKAIDATLFSVWSGFEMLTVQKLTEKGQTLVELNPKNTVINID